MGTLSKVFATVGNNNTNMVQRHLPMINSITSSFGGYFGQYGQVRRKKALMDWFKGIPEVTALISKVAKDMTSEYHFEAVVSPNRQSSRNKLLQANKFAQTVQYRSTMLSQAIDMLVTGEGYGWKGLLKDKQVKEAIRRTPSYRVGKLFNTSKELKIVQDRVMLELKRTDALPDTQGFDEALLVPRKYRYVPSTTMENKHDKYDYTGYNHIVGSNTVEFTPEEIIHFDLMSIDGKPFGFTPLESVVVQLELLRQMWQNMLSLHKNGGSPDKIIIAENINPQSVAYKRIEQQLEQYKLVENKHGNMLFTGKVSIEDMQQLDKMQFMDMGLYITGLLAMQWQIPRSSISFIVGGANTKDDTGGNSEKGYWDNVEYFQQMFADVYNSQLWIPHFGVKLVFDKVYINKDVQKQTALMSKYNNVLTMSTILNSSEKQLSLKKKMEILEIEDDDMEDFEDPMEKQARLGMGPAASGIGTPAQQPKDNDSEDKKNIKKKKKDEQVGSMNSRGKPNGVGKERGWDYDALVAHKQIEKKEPQPVSLMTFIKLYNEDKAYHPLDTPRIFKHTNESFTSFKFMSSNFVYSTIIESDVLEDTQISIMNLGGHIYEV